MNKLMIVLLTELYVTAAIAEPLKIIGFEVGSGITFEGATVGNYYTLEFSPAAGGPWTNWGSVTDQPITGSVMAIPSPFFYRIRQTDSSAFPPYAPASNITSTMLGPKCVTADKVATGAIQTSHIATSAVSEALIANSAVTRAKLGTGAVGSNQIADGAVTESKLATSGVLVTNLNADLLDGMDSSVFLSVASNTQSRNLAVASSSGGWVAAWNNDTKAWTTVHIGANIFRLIESSGNFCALSSSGWVAAWNQASSAWVTLHIGDAGKAIAASQGSFIAIGDTGAAAVWDRDTGAWSTQVSLGPSAENLAVGSDRN